MSIKFNELADKISDIQQKMSGQVAHAINIALTARNWLIGCYIVEYEQQGDDKAKYGERLLKTLEEKIATKGLTERRFREFRRFYMVYPQLGSAITNFLSNSNLKPLIWRTPSAESESWATPAEMLINRIPYSHLLLLSKIDNPVKRAFYETETIKGCWSHDELDRQITSLYYERSGLSTDKTRLSSIVNAKTTILTPAEVIKNPVSLEFLGITEQQIVSENKLEDSIVSNLQRFLLEMGEGFCFEARQKRILIDDEYFKADLVFYHRILKCHVIVDLKIDKFKHEYASQLNLYLNYYKNEVMRYDDNPPIGLLLCTDYGDTTVRYATSGLDNNLFVSKYLVSLPSEDEIKKYIVELKKNLQETEK